MYKTTAYRSTIEAVEVLRSTAHTVWVMRQGRERREAKNTSYYKYFSTEDAAVAHIRSRHLAQMQIAESNLERLRKELAEFNQRYPTQ